MYYFECSIFIRWILNLYYIDGIQYVIEFHQFNRLEIQLNCPIDRIHNNIHVRHFVKIGSTPITSSIPSIFRTA